MTTIFTIGHGNRPIEDFIALLGDAAIECLVDVRAYPTSRRHPQFTRDSLEQSLPAANIRYYWEGKALGGRRKQGRETTHAALKSPAFRAYADYMMTVEFREGTRRLVECARSCRVAVMCAERLPWECHRYLISDYLVAGGEQVMHLVNAGAQQAHQLSPAVRLRDGNLMYDGETQGDLKF